MEKKEFLELSELQSIIKERIGNIERWVRVEIESHRVAGGHHYLNLLEKSPGGQILAKAQGRIWRSNEDVVTFFQMMTGEELKAGMTVVVLASVEYHPQYGMSLIISDIDPGYTVGQRELEKQKTIDRLTREGLIDRQQALELPFLPGHVAVITSADAAGYGDFTRQLAGNAQGFVFDTTLFQAIVQGDKCPRSISERIGEIVSLGGFDLILILRGGGAESDMFAYDDYDMCKTIALCPIPVMTAVGHERDHHIADMVAREYYKTPTAMAAALIEWTDDVESEVTRCLDNIRFALSTNISAMENAVALAEAGIRAADPRNILKQGYVLATDANGIIIKKASAGSVGQKFSVRFADGRWECTIDSADVKE